MPADAGDFGAQGAPTLDTVVFLLLMPEDQSVSFADGGPDKLNKKDASNYRTQRRPSRKRDCVGG